MSIEVIEIHHHAIRIGEDSAASLSFYQGTLGLMPDSGRPALPGVPGYWMNTGQTGQIHLIGGGRPSPFAKGPGMDPVEPHVALAVKDIAAARQQLERNGVRFWSITGIAGPQAEQIFLSDPDGNLVELHQVDQCRCRATSRR
jgi:catechol 2,3-dioxygenase-like lactoylglutathione lyase family enzyme